MIQYGKDAISDVTVALATPMRDPTIAAQNKHPG